MGIRAEIKEAIKNGNLYGFVSNNHNRLSKDELVELVKNLDFTAYQGSEIFYKQFNDDLIENLNDYDFFEEE